MYKVGKYNYKSKESYQKLLIRTALIFIVCSMLLIKFKPDMNYYLYISTFLLSNIMTLHLILRYMFSKGKIKKYIFNEI